MVAKKKISAKATKDKKADESVADEPQTSPEVSLGKAVMVYPRGSQHWVALSSPAIVQIQGVTFLQGTQITGNPSHRFEQKRTMIPFETVGTIIEFLEEEDIWSKPQPKVPGAAVEDIKSPPLTSHEREGADFRHGGGRPRNQGMNHRRNRHRRKGDGSSDSGSDARFQQQYDSVKDRNFNR